jgi:hypothetical protein
MNLVAHMFASQTVCNAIRAAHALLSDQCTMIVQNALCARIETNFNVSQNVLQSFYYCNDNLYQKYIRLWPISFSEQILISNVGIPIV